MKAVTRRRVPLLARARRFAPALSAALFVLSIPAVAGLMAGAGAVSALPQWGSRMTGSMTAAIAGDGLESADAAAARGLEILAADPNVSRAWVLEETPVDGILARVIGLGGPHGARPPVRLLAATFRTTASRDGPMARRALALLRQGGLAAAVDDHGPWSGPVERLGVVAAAAAASLFLAMLIGVWAMAAASTRRFIDGQISRVRLVIQLGATDGMLAAPCGARTAVAALVASGLAALCVAAAVAGSPVAVDALKRSGWPMPPFDAWALAAGAAWPPICVAVAGLAANGAARRRVRRLS